jgi:hypothetical protein
MGFLFVYFIFDWTVPSAHMQAVKKEISCYYSDTICGSLFVEPEVYLKTMSSH